jgi:hypothetical protein
MQSDHKSARQILRRCADSLVRDVETVGDNELACLAERTRQLAELAKAEAREADDDNRNPSPPFTRIEP